MKRKWILLALLLALLLCPLLSRAQSPADAAAWLQRTIAPCFSKDDKASLAAREKIERTAVTPTLKALLARDNKEIERTHEVGRLDFDWVMNAQDIPPKWKVGTPKAEGKYVAVPVLAYWSDSTVTHTFLLESSGDSWLIADVRYPGKNTLLKILR